ncbi:MAG: hypothetical protein M0Q88_00205 [Bacilli bacterium]|nr:hypothetical protein [Bacilli bacterium]
MKLRHLLDVHKGKVSIFDMRNQNNPIVRKKYVGDIKYRDVAEYLNRDVEITECIALDFEEIDNGNGIIEEKSCESFGLLIIGVGV